MNKKNKRKFVFFLPIIFLFLSLNIILIAGINTTESAFGDSERENLFISFGFLPPTITPTTDCTLPEVLFNLSKFKFKEEEENNAMLQGEICVNNHASTSINLSGLRLTLKDEVGKINVGLPLSISQSSISGGQNLCIPFNYLLQGIPAGQYLLQADLEINSQCQWWNEACQANYCQEYPIEIVGLNPIIPITGREIEISLETNQSIDKTQFTHKLCMRNLSENNLNILSILLELSKKEAGDWINLPEFDLLIDSGFLLLPYEAKCAEIVFNLSLDQRTEFKNFVTVEYKIADENENQIFNLEKDFYFELNSLATETSTTTPTPLSTATMTFTITPYNLPTQETIPSPILATPTFPPVMLKTQTSTLTPLITITVTETSIATATTTEIIYTNTPQPTITPTISLTPTPTFSVTPTPEEMTTETNPTPTNPPSP